MQKLLFAFVFALLVFTKPIAAEFPVAGTYYSLESGVAEPYSQFDDQVVVLEAFATWCEPCKSEMYELSKLQEVYGDNLTIFSLSVETTDTLAKIEQFKKDAEDRLEFTATWKFGLVNDKSTSQPFTSTMQISGIPTTFLIDEDGKVEKKWEGVVEAANISSYINANVTFPEIDRSQVLLNQITSSAYFQVFSMLVVLLVLYQVFVPHKPSEKEV